MDSKTIFNRFLAIQLKMQKVREGLDVQLVKPLEVDASLSLTYDLQYFLIKPRTQTAPFQSIVVPITSIIYLTTSDPSITDPVVEIRLPQPPFGISLVFPSDCRSYIDFLDTMEFLKTTLKQSHHTEDNPELKALREKNEELITTSEMLREVKQQQNAVIQSLLSLLQNE